MCYPCTVPFEIWDSEKIKYLSKPIIWMSVTYLKVKKYIILLFLKLFRILINIFIVLSSIDITAYLLIITIATMLIMLYNNADYQGYR